ncbi:MAG: hypothetical protein LBH16_11510 [Treponema sp.]|jgi:ribosomal protein L9|nr:hypothetical protein [Treponema sp.]
MKVILNKDLATLGEEGDVILILQCLLRYHIIH